MFVLALVAILILGVISFGLLKLLSQSISNQRNQPKQEPEMISNGVNPQPDGDEQLATISHKIDEYHNQDTKRSKGNRIENQMYILFGLALATGSVAIAMLGIPNTSSIVVIIDVIIAFGFLGLGFWRFAILKKYKKCDWKDPWSDKDS